MCVRRFTFRCCAFCGAEEIDNVATGSSFRGTFGSDYGVSIIDGPLAGLLSRSIVVIDEKGIVVHIEQVAETTEEPDYAGCYICIINTFDV